MDSIKFYIRLITTLVFLISIATSQQQNEGYNYPTPEVPFTLPPKTTTPSGYEYPTPKIKLTLPPRTTTRTSTTPQGYEYPVPQNPLQLPRRGRRRPLESHKITPGRNYLTCIEMAKDKKVSPRPGVNCLHTARTNGLDIEDKLHLSNKRSETLPLLRNIPEDIVDIIDVQ